jgi:Skp family chaperone for outer membrane proteins
MIPESLKNRIVVVLAVLTVIFFFGMLSSCNNASRQKAARDKEMAARLSLEERSSKYMQERASLEEKVKARDKEIQDLNSELETVKQSLAQEQLVSQGLKEELQKTAKSKDPQKQVSANGKKAKR